MIVKQLDDKSSYKNYLLAYKRKKYIKNNPTAEMLWGFTHSKKIKLMIYQQN